MENSEKSRQWSQKKLIYSFSIILIVGLFTIGLVQWLTPPVPEPMTLSVDKAGRPLSSLEGLENGTKWLPKQDYVLKPSLETEMAGNQGNMYAPDILVEDGIYHMWYGAQSSDGHDAIHYCTSDNGVEWFKYGVVIPTGENNHVNDPSVVKVGNVYYMYYTVAPVAELDQIWLATSSNGINWEVQGAVLLASSNQADWDSLKVGRPSVLYKDGEFKMWFDGSQRSAEDPTKVQPNSGRHVGYANSSDGVNWVKWSTNPVFFHSGAIDVEFFDSHYVVLEESGKGILWRKGTNETTFEQAPKWLFKGTNQSFDLYGHVTPFILVENNKWVAVYTGAATKETWDRNRIAVWYPFYNISLVIEGISVDDQPIAWATSRNRIEWFVQSQFFGYNFKLDYYRISELIVQKAAKVKEGYIFYFFIQESLEFYEKQ